MKQQRMKYTKADLEWAFDELLSKHQKLLREHENEIEGLLLRFGTRIQRLQLELSNTINRSAREKEHFERLLSDRRLVILKPTKRDSNNVVMQHLEEECRRLTRANEQLLRMKRPEKSMLWQEWLKFNEASRA